MTVYVVITHVRPKFNVALDNRWFELYPWLQYWCFIAAVIKWCFVFAYPCLNSVKQFVSNICYHLRIFSKPVLSVNSFYLRCLSRCNNHWHPVSYRHFVTALICGIEISLLTWNIYMSLLQISATIIVLLDITYLCKWKLETCNFIITNVIVLGVKRWTHQLEDPATRTGHH